MQLDDFNFLKSVDKGKMHLILSNFPEQCDQAIKIGKEESKKLITGKEDFFEKIVVCGLGGSAIGGDILKTIFSESKIVIDVSRNYHLPSFVDEKTLVFAVSYSGNTEETISSFKEAVEKGCRVISIASGGELERLSREKEVAHIKIPSGFPPRCAIGFLTIPCLMLAEKITGINLTDTEELVEVLSLIEAKLSPCNRTENNPAKSLALRLKGKIPLVYGVSRLTDVVARRMKTQFNENSKVFALWDIFPEMNHNEIVPFSGEAQLDLQTFYPVFIRDAGEKERIKDRIRITCQLLKEKQIEYSEIWTEGNSILTRIFSAIYQADWVSFYLAILQGVDPTPVKFIDLLKNELKKI